MTYVVGLKGQVVIPKELRDALLIRPGQELDFERQGDAILVRKAASAPLKGRFAGSDLAAELLRSREQDRARDARRP